MLEFLTYDIKVAVLIAVFYMFYRLLLARETFHRVNRLVLLSTAVASFLLPICVITMHETVVLEMPLPGIDEDFMTAEAGTEDAPIRTPFWLRALPILYIIGMTVTLSYTLLSVLKVWLLIRQCEHHPQDDATTICVTDKTGLAPFSWMHYIVMNHSDYEIQDAAILTHERGHIRLHHSWDVLLVDLLTALQWFNPAMWMLRSDLRAIHEYEADGEVLSQGVNAQQYQYLLITKAASIGGYAIANGISHSTLKNRIAMMHHSPSRRSHLLKLFVLVPIIGLTLALNAETVKDVVFKEPQKQMAKKGQKAGTINLGNGQTITVEEDKAASPSKDSKRSANKDNTRNETQPLDIEPPTANPNKTYDIVEQMPEFPGGQGALSLYLAKSVRYPKEAEKNNIQGRVIVSFDVEKDGSIADAHVVKSIHPALDEEAIRVVNSMPKWIPGKQNEDLVTVKYTVPITFKLAGKEAEKKSHPLDSFDIEIDGKPATQAEFDKLNTKEIKKLTIQKRSKEHPKGKIIVNTKRQERLEVLMDVMTESLIKKDIPVEMAKRFTSKLGNILTENGHTPVKIKIKVDGKETDLTALEKNGFNRTGAYIDFDNHTVDY